MYLEVRYMKVTDFVASFAEPVVKAHGSSNAKAFKNAIRQAANFASSGAIDHIAQALTKAEEPKN
jgi:glycerol-3-phosphate acyltransferase PlsX